MRRYVISVGDMCAFEASLRARGVTEDQMMEAVATGIARRLERVLDRRPDIRNLVLLAGPGHNGEDGRRALARLRERSGLRRLTLEWPRGIAEIPARLQALRGASLVIDAIYGMGYCARASDPRVLRASEAVARHVEEERGLLVAVDLPSGLGADGEVHPDFAPLRAHASFCVSGPKEAQLESAGAEQSGELRCVDLGFRYTRLGATRWVEPSSRAVVTLLHDGKVAPRRLARTAHKNTRGRVLIVGGSLVRGGATRIAAKAAYRGGAGYVTLVEPPDSPAKIRDLIHASAEWLQRPAPRSSREWRALLEDHDALVFGCGLAAHVPGKEPTSLWRAFFSALREASPRPTLTIDGGGLAIFARWLRSTRRLPALDVVYTPHPKEARDLLKVLGRKSPVSRRELFEVLRAALAEFTGGALLLKGAYPWVGALRGKARAAFAISSTRLATAGSGDALAGGVAASGLRLQATDPEAHAWASLTLAVAAQGLAARRLAPGALAREIARESGIAMEEILNAF